MRCSRETTSHTISGLTASKEGYKTAPNFKDLCIVQGELNLNSNQRIYTTFTTTNRLMKRIFTLLG